MPGFPSARRDGTDWFGFKTRLLHPTYVVRAVIADPLPGIQGLTTAILSGHL